LSAPKPRAFQWTLGDAPIDTADATFVSFDNIAVGHLPAAEAMVTVKAMATALDEGLSRASDPAFR
jgi:hypothetical protein